MTRLVYGTTWVGETYYRQNAKTAQELNASKDVVGDIARTGSLALALFSVISFGGSIILPWIVEDPSEGKSPVKRKPPRLAPLGDLLQRYQMTMPTAWALSQMAFAGSMILAPLSSSFGFATTLIAFCGMQVQSHALNIEDLLTFLYRPFAMYGWAPLAIMGEEINKLGGHASSQGYSAVNSDENFELVSPQTALGDGMPGASDISGSRQTSTAHPTPSNDAEHAVSDAGIYLGIWNIFATVPQFLATFIAAAVFAVLEPGKSPELSEDGGGGKDSHQGQDSAAPSNGLSGTGVCLAIGAVCAFVGAVLTFRLRRI